ncbi:aminotransferase class III-fold pyridoxal phosphate-dependent enzyme [Leucobacter weissii]|uniref:Aminotransferase class III-fold pyridoxal phosphate-dependent enzyme n=1 Tax=Leucobacter weissii TaxID=1983706 RepID=A0A939MI89_9MICO|nr:aminotransferase class III-fold pyridoxal phosphate-dependent enzyme [Leucobacter weissii]
MIERGKGCWLWDVDGNRYLDLRLGDWTLIHGHSDDDIRRAVDTQMAKAAQIGAPEWDVGYRMADLLCDRVPSIEKVRFFASGTDANLCALRLARAFTGKSRIARSVGGYHGTSDELIVGVSVLRPPDELHPPGVVREAGNNMLQIPYNDADGAEQMLRDHAHDLAAVLIEPVMTAAGMLESSHEYLRRLRAVTDELGILLIFDEVVTFPVAYGGAQAHYGIVPDLTTLGKTIGGGLPVSAVGGRREIMDLLEPGAHGGSAPVTVMSTFGGNSASLAAGIACLEKLTPESHARMNRLGNRIRGRIDELGTRYGLPLHATGLGHLIGVHWADERVVDEPSLRLDDREKVLNINLALNNEGYYQTFTGLFLVSTAVGEQEIDGFLHAFERALRTLGYAAPTR